jgi:hypothetical protein
MGNSIYEFPDDTLRSRVRRLESNAAYPALGKFGKESRLVPSCELGCARRFRTTLILQIPALSKWAQCRLIRIRLALLLLRLLGAELERQA